MNAKEARKLTEINATVARKLTNENKKSLEVVFQKVLKDIEVQAKKGENDLKNPFKRFKITKEEEEQLIKKLEGKEFKFYKGDYDYIEEEYWPDYIYW